MLTWQIAINISRAVRKYSKASFAIYGIYVDKLNIIGLRPKLLVICINSRLFGLRQKYIYRFNNENVTAYFCFLRDRLTYSEQYGGHLELVVLRKGLILFQIILKSSLCYYT